MDNEPKLDAYSPELAIAIYLYWRTARILIKHLSKSPDESGENK